MKHIPSDWLQSSGEFFTVLYSTPHTQVASMVLSPGQTSGEFGTDHPEADQVLIVLGGRVEAKVNGETVTLGAGDTIVIEAGEQHQIIAAGEEPARTMNIYGPPAYPEDD